MKEKAEQERLAREKAQAKSKAVKQAEVKRQAPKSAEADRRNVPAAVVPGKAPAVPVVVKPVGARTPRWALVAGGAVVLLVIAIIYFSSTAQTASDQAASGGAAGGGLQPVSGQNSSANPPAAQQGTSAPASVPATRPGSTLALRSLAQEVASAAIITDPRTGLMWTRKDNGSDLSWENQ